MAPTVFKDVRRDVVRVSGPDVVTYLQGQLSQEVEDLGVGSTTWSFVLQPTGKVEVWARVTRIGSDAYMLDVDGGWGAPLAARLSRFLLRTKAVIEPLDWRCVALRGPGAAEAASQADVAAELRVPAGWPDIEGADLLGPDLVAPDDAVDAADHYESLRIRAGVPAMGAELTDKTIPAEAGQWLIDASVSFTKGCYTGQELVARIDSRGGNVPRRLRGLVISGSTAPPPGSGVVVDGAEVGRVTSAVFAPDLGQTVALGYVGRAVEPPVDAVVAGELAARIVALPFPEVG